MISFIFGAVVGAVIGLLIGRKNPSVAAIAQALADQVKAKTEGNP